MEMSCSIIFGVTVFNTPVWFQIFQIIHKLFGKQHFIKFVRNHRKLYLLILFAAGLCDPSSFLTHFFRVQAILRHMIPLQSGIICAYDIMYLFSK